MLKGRDRFVYRRAGIAPPLSLTLSLTLALAVVAPRVCSGDTPATDPAATQPAATQPATNSYGITGNWFGERDKLANVGLTFGGSVLYDYSKNFEGGISTTGDASRVLADLTASLTSDQALGWTGGTFYADLQYHDGTNASTTLVGDAQRFDNQDGPRVFQFYQAWFQQTFGNQWRVKVGQVDANTEFDVTPAGEQFLNSSFQDSPAIFNFPTYPVTALSANLFWTPDRHWWFGAGVYDSNQSERSLVLSGDPNLLLSNPGGIFSIVEEDFKWTIGPSQLAGKVGVGGYYMDGQFSRFDGSEQSGAGGMYALAQQDVWHGPADAPGASEDVCAFVQFGLADPSVSLIDHQIGGGVAWTGPIPTRGADQLGVGATDAHFSGDAGLPKDFELAIEGFYRAQIVTGLFLQPDLQYIVNPGGEHPDAFVGTLRVEVDF
jgi:porin